MSEDKLQLMNRLFARSDRAVACKNAEYGRTLNDAAQKLKDEIQACGHVLVWDKKGMASIKGGSSND